MPVLLRKQTALCLPVLSVSRGPDRAPPPPGAHKERMNPLRRSSCQRKSRRDFGVQHDGVANASSCHAQVTMEGRVFPKKKTRGNFSKDFSALYGSGRNLYRWACIECGTQHWYSGCQKIEWRDWTLVSGVGGHICLPKLEGEGECPLLTESQALKRA